MKRIVYLIDGVGTTTRNWERRQLFGEHAGARFTTDEIPLKGRKDQVR